MSDELKNLLAKSRDVAGAFRQRANHGVPDYRMVAAELPVSLAIEQVADKCEQLAADLARVTAERDKLRAALEGLMKDYRQLWSDTTDDEYGDLIHTATYWKQAQDALKQ